jgi:hypothetical protein
MSADDPSRRIDPNSLTNLPSEDAHMESIVSRMDLAILFVLLVVCPIAAGLLFLRYKLTKESEPGSKLRLTDLLMLASASWTCGTRMDLEWKRPLDTGREIPEGTPVVAPTEVPVAS